ncbi:TonB-dependent receptor [Alteromonas sp. KUL49]|uniref:TonB-dependent receptor n=1 Tax=Alteromonas sp. KUL49 TaxID=2480798 RepID=UPI00102F1C89|nr:TonB-dependent receptor [Alteromonas sp. KUL49]TAP35834.1 TonB-dependent receptor [Alteromonas sp. KUL49]GEA13211.1 TonB-dependent receptor [Alteromonas sp. KUL49]
MKTHYRFKPKMLALTIASVIGGHSYAQEAETPPSDDMVEVIEVSGIRGSLVKSMDVKRSSSGVVDAISAEDIGKFPDTNLAESLQRITGVSIDRQNNEGSRVTVRGWGPEFNLITLNGRQMPSANLNETSANNSRSFDFANLAAESVAGIEVYKTGKANVTTGGIGATINILSHKPLSNPGLLANVGIKGIMDDTRIGDDITPEISGIYSNTFADDTIGISVVASRSTRDNYQPSAQVSSGWNSSFVTGQINDGLGDEIYDAGTGTVIMGAPQNFMYRFEDFSRTRTNAQLTLQYAPTDTFTATLDYTMAKFEQEVGRQELSAWFGSGNYGGTTFGQVDANGVVSPLVLTNKDCCDYGFGVGYWENTNETDSIGLNLEWVVTDNLSLEFDAHNSTAEASPDTHLGSNNIITAGIFRRGGDNITTVDFGQNIPVFSGTVNNNGNTTIDPGSIIGSGTSFRNGYMETEIEQYQLTGEYVFDDGIIASIDFGVAHQTMNNRTAYSLNEAGNWGGIGYTGETTGGGWNAPDGDGDNNFSDDAFTVADLTDIPGPANIGIDGQMVWVDFNQFNSDYANLYLNNPGLPNNVFTGCTPGTLCANPEYSVDLRLEEEQLAFFVQANLEFDLGDMPARMNIGLRHESTDVTANSLLPNFTSVVWGSPNELQLSQDGGIFQVGEGDYDELLPNIDFQLDVTDDVVVRASYSKTLARPNYDDLQAGGSPAGSQARAFEFTSASGGDPTLLPFVSDNIDLSLEYYYDEGSYASIGYYTKDVENFVGTSVTTQVIYPDLVNPASGARLAEAQAAVVDPTNAAQEIRNYYIAQGWLDANGNVVDPSAGGYDPLTYRVTVPVNAEDFSIDGFEIALQHMFGDTGFGIMANYTTVDGDGEYDNTKINQDQFVIPGLSDSANFVAFYEKDGFQARIAYNWRDEFLSSTTGGNNQQEPAYTEAYGQLDVNVSYEVNENLTIALEGINITEEDRRVRARGEDMIIYAAEQSARYAISARYKF